MNRHYIVKIVPPWGYRVFRLRFTPQHIGFAVLCSILAFGGVAGFYVLEMRHAEARVGELRTLTDDQHARLEKIDAQAAELDNELRSIELQDDQIRKMIGAGGKTRKAGKAQPPAGGQESYLRDGAFNTVAEHIAQLRERSAHVHAESSQLRSIALHVLNMRRLEDLARARVLAAIPSLTPSGTGEIASPFGWRVDPWPEFHQGVDLVADYGEPVRAAAAGTVVSAGWDGGCGVKSRRRSRERVPHLVLPPLEVRRSARSVGNQGAADRVRRHDRRFDRAPPPLSDHARRPSDRPGAVPQRRP